MNMIRKLLLSIMFALPFLPLVAQERADSVYCFRFVPGKDRFFSPYNGNDTELRKLYDCVDTYRTSILSGKMPLYVDGYCKTGRDEAARLKMAKTRSNRVKSELITMKGLNEGCFITRNHADTGNFVTVRVVVPVAEVKPTGDVRKGSADAVENTLPSEPEKGSETETPVQTAIDTETTVTDSHDSKSGIHHLSLRANLLRWATLTPDLGLEWRISRHMGIMVNGSWTSWTWNANDRRYALWEVAPEVRWYLGKEKCGYIGAMYKAGQFNYKFSATGKQGDLMGGGITGGYQLKLNNALSLDFNLGLGYICADYDKYTVIDGVRVRRGTESKDLWGPVSAGVTLTWNIF